MSARGIDTVCEYGNIELPNLIFKVQLSVSILNITSGSRGSATADLCLFLPHTLIFLFCFRSIHSISRFMFQPNFKKRYSQNMLILPHPLE